MKRRAHGYYIRSLLSFVLFTNIASAGTLVLKKAFVDKFKDRATIDAMFFVDHAHKKANPGPKDGDMHVAGRAPTEIGLPMVAEMMNAGQKSQKDAFDRIHAVEGNGQSVHVRGAWRLWFEHPAVQQIQFMPVPVAGNTNPDHSFEIHPMIEFDGLSVPSSLAAIPQFVPYDAKTAFTSYESLSATVSATTSGISIVAKKTGYNYTQFFMELRGAPSPLLDGGSVVLADVSDTSGGEPIAENIRMIFLPGTPPLTKLKTLTVGDELHVIGIPRVSLNAISSFVQANGGKVATRKLPYEMIIVAVLGR
jgi:hypothetical protein